MSITPINAPFQFWTENPVWDPEISDRFDSIVIVASDISKNHCPPLLEDFHKILKIHKKADEAFENTLTFIVSDVSKYGSIKKMVFSPIGPINIDYDDVRRVAEASRKGIKRILRAGAKCPLLAVMESKPRFEFQELASLLGASEAIYVPLEIREATPEKHAKVEALGFCSEYASSEILHLAGAIESGRVLCRDIGGSDPERMSPPNVADYVQEMFADTSINVEVIEDESILADEYPLLTAVNRATREIERHCARVIHLSYEPEGPYDTTLALVGKGVTYDTGGADIKTGGSMAGMHRDKCGAAAVAGFFKTVAILKPKNIKVIGAMCMVRNSVGPDAYVADEIVTSRKGVRVRITNTDFEGRMAMADVLCHLKEKIINEDNVYMFTIATLTGHAKLAVGKGYSIVIDNGPAKAEKVAESLQKAGEEFGDMFEISTLRREDYEFHLEKSEYEDVMQSSNLLSTKVPRGHQMPAAFLIMTSGLDEHGLSSEKPIKYSHIDIAASSGPFPGIPSAAPIPALTKRFLFKRSLKFMGDE